MTHDIDDADARFAQRLAALDDDLRLGGEAASTGEAEDVDTRLKSAREVLQLLNAAFQGAAGVDAPPATPKPATPKPATPKPATGKRIGRFVVEGILGEGSFGRVYQARDRVLGRAVALKVAKLRDREAGQSIKRFEREAKALAVLRHPNIVTLFDYGRDGDDFYIALALIPGRTLQEEIARRKNAGTLDARWAAETAAAVADALAYAHASGIVHRDVKPGNVLIDEAGTPHLTDFGLAADREGLEHLTHTGQMLGTPLYMSPEQVRGERGTTTAASDQYSLGVVLFELLTGRTPFTGPPEKVIVDHLETDAPSPRKFNAGVPRDLETICLKALEKKPQKRYASCQELADDLRSWREGRAIQARPLGSSERVVRAVRRRPVVSALAALLVCAVVWASGVTWNYLQRIPSLVSDINSADEREKAAKALLDAKANVERHRKYASLLEVADRMIQENTDSHPYLRAEKLLDSARAEIAPTPPGFEWDVLHQICTTPGRPLKGHQSRTVIAEFSPDGKTLLTASMGPNAEVIVWNTDDWTIRKTIPRYPEDIRSVCFSKDSRWFAVFEYRGGLEIRSTSTGSIYKHVFACVVGEGQIARFCEIEGEPGRVAIAHAHRIDIRTMPDLALVRTIPMEDTVLAMAVSGDGKRIAAVTAGRKDVALFDSTTGNEIRRLSTGMNEVADLAFSANGEKLVGAMFDRVAVWDVATGTAETVSTGDVDLYRCVRFLPGDRECATMSHSETLAFARFNLAEKKYIGYRPDKRMNPVALRQFGVSPDGVTLALPGGDDNTVMLMESAVPARGYLTIAAHKGTCFGLAFTPDSRHVVTCGADQRVKIWNVETETFVRPIGEFGESVYDVAVSPDGTKLATCDDHKNVHVWDFASGKLLAKSQLHTDRVFRLCFSRDGSRVITASWDKTCRVWDAATMKEIGGITGEEEFRSLARHPFDDRVIANESNGVVRVIDASTLKTLLRFHDARLEAARQIAWTPDGTSAYCTTPFGESAVYRLDLVEGKIAEKAFDGGGGRLALSPDGLTIVTSPLRKVRFQNVISQATTYRFEFPGVDPQFIRGMAFSPDGRKFALACMDGTLRLWRR